MEKGLGDYLIRRDVVVMEGRFTENGMAGRGRPT